MMMASISSSSSSSSCLWKCFLCWKLNAAEASHCGCCQRERSFAPKSVIETKTHAKPLALHGLASALHPFREEQLVSLAAQGLDLSQPGTNGWTALHCAARLGQHDVVHNLLAVLASDTGARQAAVEAASTGGWRALHHAIASASGGHLRVVEELLLADADVDAPLEPPQDALTPLHLAAQCGHTQIVDLLLQCGANPHCRTHHLGKTALHLTITPGVVCHVETARLLCAKTDLVALCDARGMSPLQQAHCALAAATAAATRGDGGSTEMAVSRTHEMVAVLETALRLQRAGGANQARLLPAFLSSA